VGKHIAARLRRFDSAKGGEGSAIRLEGFNDLEQEEHSMRRRNLIRTLKQITAKQMHKYHKHANKKPTIRVRDVLSVLSLVEADKIVSKEMVYEEAVRRVESEGIVYLQDIDKLCDKQQYPTGACGALVPSNQRS
jgi:ATP-dependent protease HslVU (ClpYQ) ATPase subunit